MEQNERDALNREALARIDQQLKDSVQNQGQIMLDLKEIFNRIEHDSKTVTTISGDIKGHLENSKLRWDSLEKKLEEFDKRLCSVEEHADDNSKAIATEREERNKALDEESKAREILQQDINSTIRTVGWIIGALATLATILSGVVVLFQIFGKLKGVG